MKPKPIAGDVRISIEVRIEARDETAARRYADMHGIDVSNAKWSSNGGGQDGRLYTATTTPFPTA